MFVYLGACSPECQIQDARKSAMFRAQVANVPSSLLRGGSCRSMPLPYQHFTILKHASLHYRYHSSPPNLKLRIRALTATGPTARTHTLFQGNTLPASLQASLIAAAAQHRAASSARPLLAF